MTTQNTNLDQCTDASFVEACSKAVFLVEATGFERNALWIQFSSQSPRCASPVFNFDWTGNTAHGYSVQVGEIGGRGVVVSLTVDEIGGRKVIFYHGCSQLIDWEMIEAWLTTNLPHLERCNADNFQLCLAAINKLNSEEE